MGRVNESDKIESVEPRKSTIYKKTAALLGLVMVQSVLSVAVKLAVSVNEKKQFSYPSVFVITETFKFFLSWSTLTSQRYERGLISASRDAWNQFFSLAPSLALPYGVLAFLYAFNNNLGLYVYRFADISSIAVIRCGAIIVSAIISFLVLGKRLSDVQWVAMIGQSAGVFIAQVDSCEGHLRLEPSTYLIIFGMLVVSCGAAVLNEKLVKGLDSPLQCQQMTLYGFGIIFNLIAYFGSSSSSSPSHGFFYGYNPWTVLTCFMNAIMGLAVITALKYGDSIIKAMSGPVTAFVLTIFDLVVLDSSMSFTTVVATIPVFGGAYIYIIESGK